MPELWGPFKAEPAKKICRHTLGRLGCHFWGSRRIWLACTLVQPSVLEEVEDNFDDRHPGLHGPYPLANLAIPRKLVGKHEDVIGGLVGQRGAETFGGAWGHFAL